MRIILSIIILLLIGCAESNDPKVYTYRKGIVLSIHKNPSNKSYPIIYVRVNGKEEIWINNQVCNVGDYVYRNCTYSTLNREITYEEGHSKNYASEDRRELILDIKQKDSTDEDSQD
tara:strand:- start:82 stop:432 length:351 start_codon:yes stop_codon:yes gene_type:complete